MHLGEQPLAIGLPELASRCGFAGGAVNTSL